MKNALLVIDVQNDYFPQGKFPLENIETACKNTLEKIAMAKQQGWLIINIQHISPKEFPIFAEGSSGAEVHPQIAEALIDVPLIVKHQADSFYQTDLENLLKKEGITDIYLTGMMTQHCVTHTAFSPQAQGLNVHIFADCCAAPTQMLSDLALLGLSASFDVIPH